MRVLYFLLGAVCLISAAGAAGSASGPHLRPDQFGAAAAPSTPIPAGVLALRARAEEAAVRAASSPAPPPAPPAGQLVEAAATGTGELSCQVAPGSPSLRPATAAAPLRVWGGGDSVFGFVGLTLADVAAQTGVISGHGEYKTSTGLSRQDYYDWPARIRAAVAQYDPEVVVLMFGANDPLALSGTADPFGSDAWQQHYAERAAAVMSMLTAAGRQVYWLGQPVMQDPTFQAKMTLINGVVRAQALSHPGVSYCDTERFFAAPDGGFIVAPRAGDGIHLQPYAGRALGAAVLAAMIHRAG